MLLALIAWPPLTGGALALLAIAYLWRRGKDQRSAALWERERGHELESYCELQVALPSDAEPRTIAAQSKRVCRVVVEKSAFRRAALLLRGPEGQIACVGSAGLDDLSLTALNRWAERLMHEESADRGSTGRGTKEKMRKSFPVPLGPRDEYGMAAGPGCHEAHIIPIRLHRGRLVGALAVCTDGEPQRAADRAGWMPQAEWMPRATAPLELLAAKLARIVERGLLVDRLMQLERLAGAGHLVAGVAQNLAAPLATVLGSAELIAETAADPRVRQDAQTIVAEAMAMQETLHTLRGFWQQRPLPAESLVTLRSPEAREKIGAARDVA